MADSVMDILLRARMEVSGVEAGVGQIQKSLKGLTLPKGVTAELEKSFGKLTPLLKDYQKQLNKGFSNKKDLQNFNALKEKISETFGEIRTQIQAVNSQEVKLKVDTQEIDKLENKITAKTADLQKALNNVFTKTVNSSNIKEQLDKVIGNTGKAATVKPMAQAAQALFSAQDYAAYNQKIDEIKNKILSLKTTKIDLATALGVKEANKNLEAANEKVKKFFDGLKVNEGKVQTIEHLKQELQELGVDLEKIKFDSLTNSANELQGIDNLIERLSGSLRETGNAASDAGQGMVRMVDEVNELKQSTQYFFSLRNMINLLKRGIDEAVQSVKDLDKAMTETAVVTDFSVADMWKDLPKYTQIANELGATTQGAYETMTLYYQQGLNQQQAFALGAETMKMARIAGLDYAETTDMMTAALRGFNMELDEVSAKRVNDVYSKLAAITASDTEELGTAMQRTASIAASAGASFEGTTAFLAQAIETTREPAENIGTAMKTIVARFQEMKKNPLEISEVDGEEVDYNKIDAALKTIGVDLKDTNGQFRDFDEVMLDISARWDGLSQAQQRYIATTAAGSRQQSRFIAMVSNYDRTMQLMEAANNSAGASDEQFGKTMDSLEAKLNKLHNAWQQFTMGIMNNTMVKGIVDAGTTILSVVNKIIDVLSFNGQSGLIKSVLSLATAFTALKGGGKIVNSLIGGLGGLVDPQSSFKEGLKGGFFGGREQLQADRISNPIVKAIYNLIPYISKAKVDEKGAYVSNKPGSYDAARAQLNKQLGGIGGFGFGKGNGKYSIDNIRTIINDNQLDKEQQKNFFQASPGFKKNITNSLSSLMQEVGTEPQIIQSLAKGFKQGDLTLDEVLLQGGLATTASDKIKAEMSKAGKEGGKAAAIKTGKEYVKTLRQQGIQKGLKGKDLKDFGRNSIIPTEEAKKGLNAEQELSITEKMGNALGKAGAGLMQLGSGLQTIGANISTINPQLGQMVTNLGSMLTTAGSAMTALQALSNPLVLGIAAVGALIAVEEVRLNNIRTAAEEVTKTFEETNKTTQDNIATLKSYKSELAALSKGVDINGNNISLSDSDYERYLEIVDNIAQINPEIVQGYNAQGHAIIDNNNALSDTLTKLEDIQKTTLNNYIDDKSLQKLLDARNINKDFIGATTTITGTSGSHWEEEQGLAGVTRTKAAPMTSAVTALLNNLERQKGLDDDTVNAILQGYDINLEQLRAGEEKAINTFVKNQDQINAQIGSEILASGNEISELVSQSFDTLSEQTANFNTAIQPALQNLQTYVSNNPAFQNIAPEFQTALMSGLKDIVIQPDLDATQMQNQARILIKEFDNLSAKGSEYATAMDQVEQAQNDFAQSLDATEYAKGTEDALVTLNNLMERYARKTDAYSQAIAEYLQNQIDRIKNFTEEGAISLTEALNTATNEIAAAEGAYDSFKEATKSDFSTGAESMKSIFDEITKETDGIALHMEGKGDKAFWTGAESLFGTDAIADKTPEQVKKMFDRIEPMLQEGRAGFDAFWKDVFSSENVEKLKGIEGVDIDPENWMLNWDDNVNPEVFHEMAQALGMSDEFLTSMLNKGRQFGAIDFMDTNDVRKALSTDAAVVKGTSTTTIQGQNGSEQVVDMFVKGDYIKSALADAGIVTPQDQQEAIDKLTTQGVHIIKDPEQISTNDLKNMGVSDMKTLIQTLGDTGQYTKDEIEAYAQKLGDYTPEDFADGYQKYLDAQEHPEIEPIQSIQSTVQQIASILASQRIEEGHLDNTDTSKAFQRSVYGEADVRDTKAQAFAVGRNEQGNVMTAEQYKINLTDLQSAAVEAQKYIDTLSSGMKNASGQDLENMKAEKASMEATLSYLQNQISQGQQVWAEKYAQEQYDLTYQSAIDAGQNVKIAREEAESAKQNAFKEAQDLVQATQEGLVDGLASTDTSKVKTAAKDSVQKNTDTGTGGTSKTTSSTVTKGVEFVVKGAEEATKNIDDIDSKASEGATHTTEFKTSGKKETEGAIKKMTDAGSETKTVKVGASVDTSGAQKAASVIGGMSAKIGVGIKDNATAAAEKVRKVIDGKSASIDIKPNWGGAATWTHNATVRVHEQKAATGVSNKIIAPHVPVFGSLAKGTKKGRLGPKNQGGVTLTGEEGYEIAWLPNEGRSMILGQNGPQMIDLPKDAVVYNHNQSVDILRKRQTISAGSLSSGSAVYVPSGGSGTITSQIKAKSSKDNSSSKKANQAADEAIKVTQKAGKVLVWWENAGHRMDKAQRNAEAAQRKLENLLKTFGTTAEKYKKSGEEYRKYLKQQIKVASEKETRAAQELGYTANGGNPVQTKTKDQAAQQTKAKTKLDKAKKAYKKSKTKANKKKLNKAQKAYNNTAGAKADAANNAYLEAIGALQEVSYEVTTTKKGKKTKKTKTAKINTASYITQDKETGAYQLDQKAIDRLAATNKSYAEAVKQATEKQLNDILNKQKEAEEEKLKAEEALAEFYNTTYDTFYAWEKTITEAYLLSQQLEKLSGLRNIYSAVEDLELAKAEAGYADLTKGLEKLTNALNKNKDLMLEQVNANRKLIDARYEEYQSMLSMEDVLANVAAMDDAYKEVSNPETLKAVNDADARKRALEFLQEIGATNNFDYNAAVKALNSQTWNKDDYDKIKDGLDQIAEKQTAYYEAIAQTYESMTEVYQTIEEYQSYMADFEKDLISGMEEQANKEIDKLSKLNSVIDTAAKDLIDEVKRKLDERRKQEDNAKTEQDIAQKQQRLAALRADTSGGHQVEIAQLEKEIAEAQQSYGRTLEDQLLDKLSQQQDEAAKQRERQIQLLEAQRDFAAATGLNIEQINKWLQEPDRNKDQIRAAWLANQGYEDAGSLERKQLEESFDAAWMRFLAYGEALPQLEQITEEDLAEKEPESPTLDPINTIQQSVDNIVSLLSTDGIKIQNLSIADAKTDSYGQERSVSEVKRMMEASGQSVSAKNLESEGFALSDIAKEYTAKELHDEGYDLNTVKGFYDSKALKDAGYTASDFATVGISYADARNAGFSIGDLSKFEAYKTLAAQEQQRIDEQNKLQAYKNKVAAAASNKKIGAKEFSDTVALGAAAKVSIQQVGKDLAATKGLTWKQVIKAAKAAKVTKAQAMAYWGSSKTAKTAIANWSKYATGGLADYTGPAWLDGTPSKPELVLNATDTRNFLALRDVLSKAMGATNSVTNSYGGNATYEININVDKIEKDYDVDRVAERVKKIIVKDSGYRNVTQVRNFR